AGRQLLPLAGLGVEDVVRARQDREAAGVADDRAVGRLGVRAHVTPPGAHRAGPGEELLEGRGVGVGVDLVGRLVRQGVDDVLDRAYPAFIVDARLHRVWIE